MGSRRTKEERAERLRAEGVTDEQLERISAPIGLDIGSRTPEEVAVAVAAEIVATFRKAREKAAVAGSH
jgi:xanthine dehydrogenase accessory factor